MPLLAGVALPGIAPAQDIEGAASDNHKYGVGLIMIDGLILAYIQRLPRLLSFDAPDTKSSSRRGESPVALHLRNKGRGSCRFTSCSRAIGARQGCRKGAA